MQTHEFIYGFFEGFTPYSIQGRLIRYKLALNILRMEILIIAATEYIFDLNYMPKSSASKRTSKQYFFLHFAMTKLRHT